MKNSSAKTLQSSLRSANFILLVLGQGISLFGNTMLRFAMSMWVLDETASSTTFATVLAISVIPTILISPFGGVMADRVSKRAMMVALDIISGIVTLLATVFFALSGFNILAIAIMQVVLAVLDAMETPVVQSALPQIIGRESSTDLRRGAAIINQVQQLSQLLPSFLGGVMYGLVGIRPMMLITAACLMSAAMVECFIRLAKPLSNQDDAGICLLDVIIGDMHSATAFLLRKEPTVARLAGVCTWINLILTGLLSLHYSNYVRLRCGDIWSMRWHYRHCRHSGNIHRWLFRQPFEITKRPFVVVRGKSYAASAGHRLPASMFNANQAHHAGALHCGSHNRR